MLQGTQPILRMTSYVLRLFGALLISFTVLSASAQKQLKDTTEVDVKKLLSQNWHIIAHETQGKKTIMPVGRKAYINFKKDGILVMGNPGNPPESGRWSYEHSASKIKFVLMGEEDFFTSVSISNTELVLLYRAEDSPEKIFLKPAINR
jgi:hypothetical protein